MKKTEDIPDYEFEGGEAAAPDEGAAKGG